MEEPTPGAERPEPHPEAAAAPDGPGGPEQPGSPDRPEQPDGPRQSGGPDEPGAAGPGPEQPAGPQPLGVAVTPTGHAEVDDRLARLGDVDHLAVGGHLPVYEDVHRGLRDTLASLDQQPGPRPGARNDIRS
ncbi:hypothetical protein [Streptomyces sclerotialus]|uniref:hypothetical protein n=1 Tax=Streptomyces sclerotialus TaxID=1957 RepID=UPI0004C50229